MNPLIWRPLTGIHTMDIPSYRLDLTPFAGLLSGAGPHTISLYVVNNAGYWLAGGALLLTSGGGAPGDDRVRLRNGHRAGRAREPHRPVELHDRRAERVPHQRQRVQ
ncbi:MAG TPA: peptide-N4-asparagine amidase, partial [Trebonia sp.]